MCLGMSDGLGIFNIMELNNLIRVLLIKYSIKDKSVESITYICEMIHQNKRGS